MYISIVVQLENQHNVPIDKQTSWTSMHCSVHTSSPVDWNTDHPIQTPYANTCTLCVSHRHPPPFGTPISFLLRHHCFLPSSSCLPPYLLLLSPFPPLLAPRYMPMLHIGMPAQTRPSIHGPMGPTPNWYCWIFFLNKKITFQEINSLKNLHYTQKVFHSLQG